MSIVVPLYDHPAFRRGWLVRQARRLAADARDASARLEEMQTALEVFEGRLEGIRGGLASTCSESRRTVDALASGDIAAMEALRDEILRRLAERED